ncbi:MAG: uroporphyrinogen-III synthase [Pseudomonadales bacterium]|nr:MAG: uroporphyrinogen-III synthase [Pseudomonadales bacterium]
MIGKVARNVLVTRPAIQAGKLTQALQLAGFTPHLLPMLQIAIHNDAEAIAQFKQAIAAAGSLGSEPLAIFVSSNAVSCSARLLARVGLAWPAGLRCIAIGPSTLAALDAQGWPLFDWARLPHAVQQKAVPAPVAADVDAAEPGTDSSAATVHNSEQLLEQLEQLSMAGRSIYLMAGSGGRQLLERAMGQRGAQVRRVESYRRQRPDYTVQAFDRAIAQFLGVGAAIPADDAGAPRERGALLFASGETLANFSTYMQQSTFSQQLAMQFCIVPSARVGKQARDAGLQRVIVAGNASQAAFLHALQSLS